MSTIIGFAQGFRSGNQAAFAHAKYPDRLAVKPVHAVEEQTRVCIPSGESHTFVYLVADEFETALLCGTMDMKYKGWRKDNPNVVISH